MSNLSRYFALRAAWINGIGIWTILTISEMITPTTQPVSLIRHNLSFSAKFATIFFNHIRAKIILNGNLVILFFDFSVLDIEWYSQLKKNCLTPFKTIQVKIKHLWSWNLELILNFLNLKLLFIWLPWHWVIQPLLYFSRFLPLVLLIFVCSHPTHPEI